MRKFVVVLVSVVILMLSITAMIVCAEDIPTAKVTATLVGDEIPVVGEKFTIAINVNDISSNFLWVEKLS